MTPLPELLRALSAARATGEPHRLRAARGRLHRALRDDLPTDPLLAASCAAAVADDDLRTRLEAIASALQPRTASALALVTDGQGQGQVVEVRVSLSPGGTGTWTAQDAERDALTAAQLAVAVALGPQAGLWGVRWQLKGADAVRGSSLGLAVAVATRAAQLGVAGPQDQAFTGAVDLGGQLAAVHGIPAKLRAAAAAGLAQVTVPAESRASLNPPEGLTVVGAASVEPVLEALFGAPETVRTRRIPRRAAWLVLPVLAAWTGLLDPLDGWLQEPVSRWVLGPLTPQWTAVLPLPEAADTRALRADYPRVFQALADAGATAVVLDVTLGALTEHDAALTAGLTAAASAGTPVVLPVLWRDGGWQGPGDPALADAAHLGVIELDADRVFGRVRRAPARLRADDGSTHWHAAVQALSLHLDAEPRITDDVLHVGVTRNPLAGERLWLPPVAASPQLDWADPGPGAADRIVLIGRTTGRADHFPTSSGTRYGVEIHAALVETLAAQAGLRRASAATDAALTALVTALCLALGLALPRRRRWAITVVPLAALAALALALGAGWLLAPAPLLLAGLLSWAVVRRA